jgi:hypothetical protein
MKKATANPTSQWSSKASLGVPRTRRPSNVAIELPDFKQAFFPSSLDLTFTLSFKR